MNPILTVVLLIAWTFFVAFVAYRIGYVEAWGRQEIRHLSRSLEEKRALLARMKRINALLDILVKQRRT